MQQAGDWNRRFPRPADKTMILLHPSSPSPNRPLTLESPGTFAALMDLYEQNYIGIRRLLPVMPSTPVHRVSRTPSGLDLHFHLVERSRYTSELILTYQFDQKEGAFIAEPNLRIRVYHDARQAEVLAAHPRHYPPLATHSRSCWAHGPHLPNRWRINRFLYKWLSYCLHQGHRFAESLDPPG